MPPRAFALLVLSLAAAAGCSAPEEGPRLPDGIAVLGDSISRATNVAGQRFGDQPVHSYATGSAPDDGILSHLERVRALDRTLDVVGFNDARAGARMNELAQQAQTAIRQGPQYAIVLFGANDVCAGTSASEFAAELHLGAEALSALDAEVLLASVPDVTQLVGLYGENATARAVWRAYGLCPRILGEGADLDASRALIAAYNAALEAEATARGWHWDGGAVTRSVYEAGDVSTLDFFHPSLSGQARLANVTWEAGPYLHANG